LRELWLSRELLTYLVRTEIKVKYKNSVLGLVWSMVAPAMTLVIYWFVFGVVLRNGIPNFVIFLFAGLLLWNLFQLGVLTGTGTVVNNAGIVKKVSFPREIGVVLACALGVLLSSVNVYLRDTQHLIEVILTAWFWACPIVYAFQKQIASRLAPKGLTWVYFLNPMVPLVLSFQRCIYAETTVTVGNAPYPVLPSTGMLWYAGLDLGVLAIAVVLFLVALAIFGRLEGNFAEEL
jgi:ABC-2 type transport system permease protein